MLLAALGYARLGFQVFPANGKKPFPGTNGWKDATSNLNRIRELWERWPGANVAIATGKPSDIFVLDVDTGERVDPATGEITRKQGPDSLTTLIAEHGPLPKTARAITGTGGLHFLFRHVEGLRNSAGSKLGPDLDTRGDGGYIIAPPSIHPDTREPYRWDLEPDGELAPVPEWMVAALTAKPEREKPQGDRQGGNGGSPHDKRASRYALAALDAEAREVGSAAQGQRNDTLNRAAFRMGQLHESCGLSETVAASVLVTAAMNAGLEQAEAERTFWSGWEAGLKEPRTPGTEQRGQDSGPGGGNARESDTSNPEPPPWEAPQPIPDTLRPVPAMVPELLPAPLRPWLADVANRMQCPLDFLAVAAIVAIGSVIGTAIRIRPKRRDDWTVTPNLWGMLIGNPSSCKSPALAEGTFPLQRLEALAKQAFDDAQRDHEFTAMEAKARSEALKRRLAEAAKAKKDTQSIRDEYMAEEEPAEPVRRRYILNDPTVEALGERLNENPRGLLVLRDELMGWIKSLEKPGHESDRAFYLEAWNGSSRFAYDRIGRGTLDIGSATVSLLGGIQPGPIAALMDEARSGGAGNDGLIQRFQLMVFPDPPKEWRTVDEYPDKDAKARALQVFDFLAALDPGTLAKRDGDDGPHFVRFDDEAQGLFYEWQADLMGRLREADGGLMQAHLAKFGKLMPALALIFHLIEVADGTAQGPVSLEAAEMAAAWCDYLEAHAERVYGVANDGGYSRARILVRHIQRGDLTSPFTARDVLRKGWQSLTIPVEVGEALDVAEEFGWVARMQRTAAPRGGRPTADYLINPMAWKGERP
jgi:putative DNA primase/helicase